MRYQRQRNSSDPGRMRDVRAALASLLAEVSVGSELLYDGLPALSLDEQPLATATVAHLARPAIPVARELLRSLCAAASLCLECVGSTLRQQVEALRVAWIFFALGPSVGRPSRIFFQKRSWKTWKRS